MPQSVGQYQIYKCRIYYFLLQYQTEEKRRNELSACKIKMTTSKLSSPAFKITTMRKSPSRIDGLKFKLRLLLRAQAEVTMLLCDRMIEARSTLASPAGRPGILGDTGCLHANVASFSPCLITGWEGTIALWEDRACLQD